jgi:hypothetical protein
MARANRAQWAKRVERWKDSGLTAKEFSAEAGINPSTLSYWKWRLGSESSRSAARQEPPARQRSVKSKPAKGGEGRFVAVPAAAVTVAPTVLEVMLGEVRVRVPVECDEATLMRVVRALEAAR